MILNIESGEDALKTWRDAFEQAEKARPQLDQAQLAASSLPINALAGPSGVDSDGNSVHHSTLSQNGNANDSAPGRSAATDGEDLAAFALAALAPAALARSDSARLDELMSSGERDETPRKNARSEDAREKNRVKQRLYRERQKAKMQVRP